ncbi:ubinuclein-2-like isoform X1 [Myxocyprinus asiaticus]|uniref:ubinuclein-2-like isoform X1 n=1 Tax=Myxocyprinus asiaticus TaxID=70543 RepID=UPI0022236033|nr:ubinuclein-2-like isoform X1 [Myxocyprinus asiaticus]
MADPRKVPFVTLASYSTTPAPESKKRRREDEENEPNPSGAGVASVGLFGAAKPATDPEEPKPTVRLNLSLSEPSEQKSAEFNYSELIHSSLQARKVPHGLTPALDPSDPFADEDKERQEVEALARKFESKYGNSGKKKRRDRVQDLIDIGYGYDETDPFIDNSEAYDELVPASLTTKLGGFYINTGTLQFRAASESEGEDGRKDSSHIRKDGEERVIKRRKKKQDGGLEEKKPRKFKVPKPGVSSLNRPEKKKRKKLMKDSLSLAAMIRRFTREKEEMRKKNPTAAVKLSRTQTNAATPGNDLSMADLTSDPAVMSLLGGATENDMLQELMGDLDFGLLDSPQPSSPGQSENVSTVAQKAGGAGRVQKTGFMPPPPLPTSLPAPVLKRIEDLRAASRQFDVEGRKKFFTLDMNNILLDIELQVQEQPPSVRSAVYAHLEAFVPCSKEALLKRLKKLSLNIQDDRLKTPLLKLKLAVCSVMPEQIARYNMDCMAKVAKQHSEDGERNGSEEEDEEKPGRRVMGPRKKFVWDDKLRNLLCNLVRVKLGCYELEGQSALSPEDYLKVFMDTEVKPLWPKGWMQARMLFKESRMAHDYLTGNTVKKRVLPTPKAKPKPQDSVVVQRPAVSVDATPPLTSVPQRVPSPPEPICLSDSLDEDLTPPSLDSISQALAMLSSAAKGLVQSNSPPATDTAKPTAPSSMHASPHLLEKTSPPPPPRIISSSASPSVRSEGVKGVGVLSQTQRHSVIPAQRPVMIAGVKSGVSAVPSPPKPRPPPTASPLHAPQKILAGKTVVAMPMGLIKTSNNGSVRMSGVDTVSSSPQSRTHTILTSSSPSVLNVKGVQPFHLTSLSQAKNPPRDSPSPSQPKPTQHQPGFITPMQATITKSPHNSNSPIIKLTPTASSASRPPTLPIMHQHTAKSPGFHAGGFSGGSYSSPVGQKNSSQGNTISGLTTTTSTVSKQPATTASPAAVTANHNQRQRQVGGASQGVKTITSVSSATASQLAQVSSSSALLGSANPSLPLGFGMLGGLVPVSLPFQFPNLLNLPPSVVSTTATSGTTNPSGSGFNLTQNLLKGLMSGAQAALPPHLQLAFSDVNQTQGGDLKRKPL